MLNFFTRKDWKGYSVIKKGLILLLFSIFPYRVWKKYSASVIRSLEINNVDVCNDKALMDFIFELKYRRCSHLLMTFREMINIYRMVRRTENLDGDITEVGVYRGGSAAIMAHFKGNRRLNLFDTFEGLPDVNKEKDVLEKGSMNVTSEQMVKNLLKDYNNWFIYKGIFPDTSEPVRNNTFSFVHLDTDLYDGTLQSLNFFYNRMQQGGIIMTHDYNDLLTPGVKEAFDLFFKDKSESIVELWDTHALVVKQ
jgi:O-methyltransferase